MQQSKSNLKKYVKENKDELNKLAKHGNPVVRAMALSILKVGGEDEENHGSIDSNGGEIK
ncbi:MAG: hypothetical protein ACOC5D_05535 [Thermoplasmatota archaeon]